MNIIRKLVAAGAATLTLGGIAAQCQLDKPFRRLAWAAPRFPDSGIGAISCCTLPVQVLVVNFLRSPVAER